MLTDVETATSFIAGTSRPIERNEGSTCREWATVLGRHVRALAAARAESARARAALVEALERILSYTDAGALPTVFGSDVARAALALAAKE